MDLQTSTEKIRSFWQKYLKINKPYISRDFIYRDGIIDHMVLEIGKQLPIQNQ